MENDLITLGNICGGAVEELFQRELEEVLKNIGDVNTDPEAKRKITMEFTLKPFEDRSGAQIWFAVKSKVMPAVAAAGTMFLQRRGTSMVAIPHDPQQAKLFRESDKSVQ